MICEIISEDFFFKSFFLPREARERREERIAPGCRGRLGALQPRKVTDHARGNFRLGRDKVSEKDKVVLLARDVFASEPGLSPLFNDEKPNREVMGAPFPQAALISFDTV